MDELLCLSFFDSIFKTFNSLFNKFISFKLYTQISITTLSLVDVKKSFSFDIVDEACFAVSNIFHYDFEEISDVSIEIVFYFGLSS